MGHEPDCFKEMHCMCQTPNLQRHVRNGWINRMRRPASVFVAAHVREARSHGNVTG